MKISIANYEKNILGYCDLNKSTWTIDNNVLVNNDPVVLKITQSGHIFFFFWEDEFGNRRSLNKMNNIGTFIDKGNSLIFPTGNLIMSIL